MKVTTALVGLASLLFSATALAQDAVTAEQAPAEAPEAAAEAPKHDRGAIAIPLGNSETADLRLSFDYRGRGQYIRPASYAAGPTTDDSASAFLSRLRIGADLELPGAMGFKAIIQDSRAFGSEPRAASNTGSNSLSFLEAYWRFDELVGKGVKTRLGRQQWSWGSGRMLGIPDFGNTSSAFDGLMLSREGKGYTANAYLAVVNQGLRADTHEYMGALGVAMQESRAFNFDALMLWELRQDPVTAGGVTADAASKFTWAPRAHGYFGDDVDFLDQKQRGTFGYEVEAALQHGEQTEQERSVLATAISVRFEYNTVLNNGSGLTVEAGYDFASGDSNLADSKDRTFRAPYPNTHQYLGHADLFGRSNITDMWASVRYYDKGGKWTGYAALHHFRRASSGDGMYGTNGVMVRPAGANFSRELGTEVDLAVKHQCNSWMSIELAYSHFFAGQYIKNTAATNTLPSDGLGFENDGSAVYLTLQLKF